MFHGIQMVNESPPCLQTLKSLIERCWHPNPERRPSFLTVINELSGLLDGMPRKVCLLHSTLCVLSLNERCGIVWMTELKQKAEALGAAGRHAPQGVVH